MTFTVSTHPDGSDAVPIGTAAVVDGTAVLATPDTNPFTTLRAYLITASYGGDLNFDPATAARSVAYVPPGSGLGDPEATTSTSTSMTIAPTGAGDPPAAGVAARSGLVTPAGGPSATAGSTSGRSGLARTGAPIGVLLGVGLLLVGAGVVAVGAARRIRHRWAGNLDGLT